MTTAARRTEGSRQRRSWCAAALFCCLLALCGCSSGFFNPKSTGTGSGGGTGGGGGTPGSGLDSIYVANSNPSTQSVAGFSLSSTGQLASLSVSPASTGTPPTTLAINPAGTLVWVGSPLGSIYVYVVNSNGTLSLGNNGGPVLPTNNIPIGSMVVDPSGNYLLVLSNPGTNTAQAVYVYQIDSNNGTLTALTENGNPYVTLDIGSAGQIAFAPNGTQVYVTLGTGGVDALTFSPSNGGLGKLAVHYAPFSNGGADQGLAFDSAGQYLFMTETAVNAVRVFTINPDSTLTEVPGSPYPTGLGAKAVVVDRTGAYVYVSNSTVGTISGFSLSSTGTLAPLPGSPYATGGGPSALAEDSSSGYLVAVCSSGNPDLQVFSITAGTGVLASASTTNTSSVNPSIATALAVAPAPTIPAAPAAAP